MGVATSVLSGIGTAFGIGGTLLGAFGAVREGQANAAAQKYAMQVAANNAIAARAAAIEQKRRSQINAEDALARGKVEEARQRMETGRLLSRQIAVLGSSGAIVGAGSSADILADTAALGELDALTIRSNAEREALAIRTAGADAATQLEAQAAGQTAQAAISGAAAQQATTTGLIGAGSTLLSGTATVAQKWYNYNRET